MANYEGNMMAYNYSVDMERADDTLASCESAKGFCSECNLNPEECSMDNFYCLFCEEYQHVDNRISVKRFIENDIGCCHECFKDIAYEAILKDKIKI